MFGTKLRAFRQAIKLSMEELAEKVETSQGNISMYERGERMPRRPMVEKIADALELNRKQRAELMAAAGFVTVESDGELERIPDDAAILVEAYNGASPQNKELLRTMAEKIREMDSDHSIGGRNRRDD